MKLGILAIVAGLILLVLAVYPLYGFVTGFLKNPLNITETQTNCNGTIGILFNITYNNEVEMNNATIDLKLIYSNGKSINNVLFSGNLYQNETVYKCIPAYYFENATQYEFSITGKIAGLYNFNITEVNKIG
ncbi:hypothetical protein [Caldisphaera sp.]|uniref:hypothetical protein n=1 Tax=Caldisphaera sp. TaxID=2060322 RepID=UPI003978E26B